MKSVVKIIAWILSLAILVVLIGFIDSEYKKTTCKGLEVTIDYKGAAPLISIDEINKKIYNRFDSLAGKKLIDINSGEMESYINEIDFIERAEVYSTLTGMMKINLVQRSPLVRVMNLHNQSFYIDQNGFLMPVHLGFSSRKLVANGHIHTWYSDTLNIRENTATCLNDIYTLASYINNHEFLSAQIEQIYVTKNQEYELIPKVGRHLIVFGDILDMEQKFEKLITFYHKGLNKVGWDKYKIIKLKFKGQVVCAKK
ncbi:MAG: hypothetical protein K8S16_20735 [Bacteroidales bacterium]|nr:hypothetical protein [Bacteroidales bacterium]